MSLFRGRLFAGAIFAGALFFQVADAPAPPATPIQKQGGFGGGRLGYYFPNPDWVPHVAKQEAQARRRRQEEEMLILAVVQFVLEQT